MKDMPPQVAKKIGRPVTTAVLSLRRWVGAARRSSCRRDHICTKRATNNEPETVGSVVASCDCGYRALLPRGHGSRVSTAKFASVDSVFENSINQKKVIVPRQKPRLGQSERAFSFELFIR